MEEKNMDSITVVYKVNSVGALRCAKVVNAIVSDVKGLEGWTLAGYDQTTYTTYRDSNGWCTVTIFPKENGHEYYIVMKRDERRHRCTSLSILAGDDGCYVATTYTWVI